MMQKQILMFFFLLVAGIVQAQTRFPQNQISINGFRNPSIGLEYHRKQFSIHGGYYLTNFESGVTTKFVKSGITYMFLPWGRQEIPSSLYVGVSYLRGLSRDYENRDAFAMEAGVRYIVWKGINLRLGVIVLAAKDRSTKINPTPSINYSFKF